MAIHTFCSTASVVVFMLCFRTGVAEIVTKPMGTEAVVGRSTYLNCSTNSPQEIHWFHTSLGSTQDRNFVYGYNQFYAPYLGRFAIEKNQANGAYNLIIPSVKVEDAGQYECQDQNGQGKKESAQLTVLDTDPACEPRTETLQIIGPNKCGIESGQLFLSCKVKYHGNEAPIMKWSKTGDKNTISEGVTHQITDNNLIVYNLTIKGNSTVKDGDSYFCNTTRSATLNGGCKSGKIKVKGTTSETNSYTAAVICFFLIILPTAIIGTAFVVWCLLVYRPRKLEQRGTKEVGTAEETHGLHRSALSPGDSRTDLKSKVKTLGNEISVLQQSLMEGNETIKNLRQNDELNKAEIKELELRLYPKENIEYVDKPVLAHTIELSDKLVLAQTTELPDKPVLAQTTGLSDKPVLAQTTELPDKPVLTQTTELPDKPVLTQTTGLSDKLVLAQTTELPEKPVLTQTTGLSDKPVLAQTFESSDKPLLAKTTELSEKNERKTEKNKGKSDKKKGKSEYNKGKSENDQGKFEEDKAKSITGITVLSKDLFVVIKHRREIEVYDSKTFKHQRNMEIKEMTDPLDIASSKDDNCLYIVCLLSDETESKVLRIDYRGKILHQWPTGGRKGRLSTSGSNVILCLSDKQLINEYSPDGELIVTVRLSPAAKLNNPLHAIKVTSTCFVVSHGDFNDELHRVCVVDLDGEIKRECKKWEKSIVKVLSHTTMKVPICLVEDNERSIIVADTENKRILLLSSMLKYQRKLIEEKNDLKDFPVRLCFDDTQSRLFVAVNKWNSSKGEWEGGRIQIFNIK